ncbi:hypothetical protein F9802_06475 [Bacillus aerolatus]|uniref:DUF3131 domain-containing protein n=1 Tax=Bacillus aerolatus TaxID=2653354 RepID=A0A6I1FWI9_9BACI|nr:hypothetical protein [Bacillus aerolatus]KAB7707393.1 hypothetical protein F9802_06475 [Bacillus aerolatus]
MMKKLIILILLSSVIVTCVTCVTIFNKNNDNQKYSLKLNNREKKLWNDTIRAYLQEELKSERDFYDAGHFLMVPLHYAYQSSDKKIINDFEEHFDRFAVNGNEEVDVNIENKRLSTLHYYYLISRYILLADSRSTDKDHVNYLANYLLSEIERLWIEIPAWQWEREDFQGGMRQRVLWKLENKNVDNSYYRAFVDEEFFTFAIAADLSNYFSDEPILNDILRISYLVFQKESKFDKEGRWLFQPGVWSDHPDYLYAGYGNKKDISEIKTIKNIAADSSHSHRFPLWIESFIGAYPKESEQRELFLKIHRGLEKQFFDKVLIAPDNTTPYYKLNNFMDGYNGVYRWDYATIQNNGYGPYELSGTFTIGWWTFLGSDRIKHVYSDLAKQFPLSEEAVDLYSGPSTTRNSKSFSAVSDSYNNGYKEILAILASKIR